MALESWLRQFIHSPILILIIGILLWLFGWTFYKLHLRCLGGLLGLLLGVAVAHFLLLWQPLAKYEVIVYLLSIIIFTIIGVIIFLRVYYIAVFVGVFFFALYAQSVYLKTVIIWQNMVEKINSLTNLPIGATVLALICAILALVLHKYLIILITSFLGSMLLSNFFGRDWTVLPFWICGLLVQLGITRLVSLKPRAHHND